MFSSLFVIASLLFSVILGGILVTYLQQTNKNQLVKLLLAFSGGFLLSIAFLHFIPELYGGKTKNIGIYILVGFLIQLILEFFSGGIEHGHVHVHKGQKMPWGLFISLSVHSVLEGIPLGNQLTGAGIEHLTNEIHHHADENNSLLLGIVFHQLPVGIALMTLLMHTKLSLTKSWIILLLFAAMTPLGVVFGMNTNPENLWLNSEIILAVVVGMFLHISTTIIFETSENHKFNLMKLIAIFIGCGLVLLML